MFSTQLGNFPFATAKIKQQDNSNSNNLPNRGMETNNGAGDSNQSQIDKTKLIVNYIPQFATEDDLAQIFAPVGRVESIKIMRDYKTGYSFGFGFVKYATAEDATKAIEVLNGYNFRNKRLKVSYSRPPGTDMKDSNLYITNLPKDITEVEVDNLFRDYGEIVQRTVLKDKVTGMPRGVAFVRYSKGEEAQAAISNLHGKMLENAMLPLSVRVAEDHGRQKAQYLDVWDPMGFNRELDIDDGPDPEEELIEAVYHRKPLWDFSLPETERTEEKTEKLWREIVYKFEDRYSLDFLIKKWRQLRDDYNDQRRKLLVYVPGEDPPKVTFYYYEYMKFLNGEPTKFRQKQQPTQPIQPFQPMTSSQTAVEPPAMKKAKILPRMVPPPSLQMLPPPPKTLPLPPLQTLPPPPQTIPRSPQTLRAIPRTPQSSPLQSSPLQSSPLQPASDGVEGFLKVVGETLRVLPLKLRTKVQIKILQVLDEEALIYRE